MRKSLYHFRIITLRGVVILFMCIFLFIFPVRKEYDILSSMLALSLLLTLLFAIITNLILTLFFNRKFSISVIPGFDNSYENTSNTSRKDLKFLYEIKNFIILPFFRLHVKCSFHDTAITPPEIILSTPNLDTKNCFFSIRFPYRGLWHIQSYEISSSDVFGLSKTVWVLEPENKASAIIHPSLSLPKEIPIISSSSMSGDDHIDLHKRMGEPFDLKPYHPSDGLKKILWKTFAKTGQLISRHPESSLTPDGYTLLFGAFHKTDDALCHTFLTYIELLIASNLEVYAHCAASLQDPVTTLEEARKTCIGSSCTTTTALEKEFQEFIAGFQIRNPASQIGHILIFCSTKLLSLREKENFMTLGNAAVRQGIEPIYIIEKEREIIMYNEPFDSLEKVSFFYDNEHKQNSLSLSLREKASSWFFSPAYQHSNQKNPSQFQEDLQNFFSYCHQHNWRVIQ
jgi:hypothetical protein